MMSSLKKDIENKYRSVMIIATDAQIKILNYFLKQS